MTQRKILKDIEDLILNNEIKTVQDTQKIRSIPFEATVKDKDYEEMHYLEEVVDEYQEALRELLWTIDYMKRETKKCKLVQMRKKLIAIDFEGVKIKELNAGDMLHWWDERAKVYRIFEIICDVYADKIEYSLVAKYWKGQKYEDYRDRFFGDDGKRVVQNIDKSTIYRIKV